MSEQQKTEDQEYAEGAVTMQRYEVQLIMAELQVMDLVLQAHGEEENDPSRSNLRSAMHRIRTADTAGERAVTWMDGHTDTRMMQVLLAIGRGEVYARWRLGLKNRVP